jgi:hypothetical protein
MIASRFVGELVIVAVIALIIWLIGSAAKRGAARGVAALGQVRQNGMPGRGLVLASSVISVGTTVGGRRFEQRTMTIEVEVAGRAPYVIQGTFLIPRGLVEAIPGSSLELAVDPSAPNNLVVLGPGGFTGPWLNIGPPQPY